MAGTPHSLYSCTCLSHRDARIVSKASILIVEDDPHTAEFIRVHIHASGYTTVGIVSTAADAIDLARSKSPDLILMDIILSGDMDGIETARIINSTQNIPVLYLTAQTDDAFFERAKVTEPFAYLLKPLNERELNLTIGMALYRHQLESKLKLSEKHLAEAQRIGHLGSWSMDFATGSIHWSDEIFRIFGRSVAQGDIDYEKFMAQVHPEDQQLVSAAIQNAREQGNHYSIHHRIIQADGLAKRIVHHTGEITLSESGKPQHMTGTLQDVTEHKSTEARLWHMAHHDPLCGLPNRMLMYDRLSHAIVQSHRNKAKVALMLFDLDDFKRINDSFGHQAGDALLVEISDRLRRSARECDTVARLGGDEFTLIIEQLKTVGDAVMIVNKILTVMQEPVCLDGQNIQVTCSIGIALYPDDATTLDGLLKASDSAMYEAKRAGKNNFQFYIDVKRQTH